MSTTRLPVEGPSGSGLTAVPGADGRVYVVATARGSITNAVIIEAGGRSAPLPTSARRARAWMTALADLRDARNRPVPWGDASDWPRSWRDAEGRTLPEAILVTAVPAYLNAVQGARRA